MSGKYWFKITYRWELHKTASSCTVFSCQTPCSLEHFSDSNVRRYSLRASAGVLKTRARLKLKLVYLWSFQFVWVVMPCLWGLAQRHIAANRTTGNWGNLKPRAVYSWYGGRPVYYTTKWGKVFLRKLTVAQLLKTFMALCWTCKLITIFKTARHRAL